MSSSQSTSGRRIAKPRYAKSKKTHNRLESCETPLIHGRSQPSVGMPQDPTLQHHGSESTISAKSSPRNRLRNNRSRAEENLGHAPNNTLASSLPISDDEPFDSERDVNGFVDRFRQLISQYTLETEQGLRFARSDGSLSQNALGTSSKESQDIVIDVEDGHQHYHYANVDEEDDFYSNAGAHTVQPYDYEQNYPADEHVRMMNAYIRRMPTIESVGSRELQSTIGAASFSERDRAAVSRPPTRNTVASWTGASDISGSEPRSRPTSLSAQAELLAGMFGRINASEVGELTRRGDTVRIVVGSLQGQSANDDSSEALGEGYASITTSSKDSRESTANSFHTASSGSTRSTASSMSLRTALADTFATPLPLILQSSPLRQTMIREEPES